MHHLVKPEDVKQALGPGGAMETFLKAKEEGKVKYSASPPTPPRPRWTP